MSLICHRTRVKSRYILSILVGLSLGFLLSVACLPLITICEEEQFSPSINGPSDNGKLFSGNRLNLFRILNRHARSADEMTLVDYASKDYEPKIHPLPPEPKSGNNKSVPSSKRATNHVQITRPRYIADELGIREKVLVAVLTETQHLNTFGIFLNQTLQEHVNRLLFFVDDEVDVLPPGMHVLAINDRRAHLKPFYVLKYLSEKMLHLYDWFLLVPDNTFIRGFQLMEFLNHISVNQDLYLGQAFDDVHAVYCFFGSGIILSGTVIRKILDELEWCSNNAYSSDLTDNIGRCILKAAKLPCVNTASNHQYRAYVNYRFEFDTDIAQLSKSEAFNQTLTVHPVHDLETMLKLQKYFNQVEIDAMTQTILEYQGIISNLSCYTPEGCENSPWPIGVPPPFKPPTRYDVLRWDYFNETHMYFTNDDEVINPMKRIDHEDVNEVITYALEEFRKKYQVRFKFQSLINGYRQFDPTRGTHYILDMSLIDEKRVRCIKRAELMRPLGLVEIIPMPSVTETSKIFLILPIFTNELSAVRRFLRHANGALFDRETRERFELLLTHVVSGKQEFSQSQKWFEPIRADIDLMHETRAQLVVTYHTLLLSSPSIPHYIQATDLLDFFQHKVRPNALIFITNPHVDIDSDFLNRCRLNVIENTQIFFPIGFYQYHPKIIARTYNVTDSSTIDLHKSHGWFNAYAFDHVGLYISDYIQAKTLLGQHNISTSTTNLYDLFGQWTDLHILRAPDQSLRVHYRAVRCHGLKQLSQTEYNRCVIQHEKGLASRGQLAMVIVEQEQNQNSTKKPE